MIDFVNNIFININQVIESGLATFLPSWLVFVITTVIKGAVLVAFIMVNLLNFVYLERRLIGRFQARLGPNRVGPFGLLQNVADAIKILTKEDITPRAADHFVHAIAPVVTMVPVFLVFAVIPIGNGWGRDAGIPMSLADLNVGVLYVVAVTSIEVLGILMAGWGSNNKFALFGGMRAVAAVISYEIPVVLALIGPAMIAGSLSLGAIVETQQASHLWFIVPQFLAFVVFFLGSQAELNRSPFDILEAEQEIVAGFHTEYSGFKFSIFYLAEYAAAVAFSALITAIFLGGGDGWILPSWFWFLAKMYLVFFLMLWIRATLPRLRADQVMHFAWKFLLPLALVNILLTALGILVVQQFGILT
ncbi:MAG TPA: NADH-quinone oxidoreductase subunit NuoH [Dehalococcoidia bacterium]|nr:NADH-quinone oxidoreductase subunit NuoH [Dehalococcoidia bacterium]